MNPIIDELEKPFLRENLPDAEPGDTVKVFVRIVEGNKERIQIFQGTVIARKGAGIAETFTVRKISSSVGVERTFSVHSPLVAKIEVVRRGAVRRTKLYYLRGRTGKATRIKDQQA